MTKEEFEEFASKCEKRLTLSSFRSKPPLSNEKRVCGSWMNRGNECRLEMCKEWKGK